jgi:N-acetylglucosamine kinase-like BadF-type ATPase
MSLVFGVDGGGTGTRCMVADDTGRVLAVEQGPPCALAVEPERALSGLLALIHCTILDAVQRLPQSAGPQAIAAGCLGLSGVSTTGLVPRVRADVRALLQNDGYSVPEQRLLVVSDFTVAHVAALGGKPGVVLIVGTGAVAFGRTAAGEEARADGWGWLMGDAGSGFAIGREALRAVAAAADGRGRSTALVSAVLAHFGVSDVAALARQIYLGGLERPAIAGLAEIVCDMADNGDSVACAIVRRAACELAATVMAVVRRLAWGAPEIPVSAQGGLMRRGGSLAAQVWKCVLRQDPRCAFLAPQGEPVEGAVYLARMLAANGHDQGGEATNVWRQLVASAGE